MPQNLHGRLVRLDWGRRAPYFRLNVDGKKPVVGFLKGEGAGDGQDRTLANAVEVLRPVLERFG